MCESARPRDGGFTLVELLVSLVVMTLMSLLLIEGFAGAGVALTHASRSGAEGDAIDAVRRLLTDRLQRITPATNIYVRPIGPNFEGRSDRIRFLAPPRLADPQGMLRWYQLSVDAGGDLVLDARDELALDQRRWSARQVLMHGVQALDLAYYGPVKTDRTPAWRSAWAEEAFMPALIRVRLALPEGDRRHWPDLVVHPAADIDTDCILNLPAGGCRGR